MMIGKATQSVSTIPKFQDRSFSVKLCDIDSVGSFFARLSIRIPHRIHTKSGMRTRFRLTSFHNFVSVEPRSNSRIRWPRRFRSAATARLPTAPRTIFSKKLESDLYDGMVSKLRRSNRRLNERCSQGVIAGRARPAGYLPLQKLRKYSYPTCTFVILTRPRAALLWRVGRPGDCRGDMSSPSRRAGAGCVRSLTI